MEPFNKYHTTENCVVGCIRTGQNIIEHHEDCELYNCIDRPFNIYDDFKDYCIKNNIIASITDDFKKFVFKTYSYLYNEDLFINKNSLKVKYSIKQLLKIYSTMYLIYDFIQVKDDTSGFIKIKQYAEKINKFPTLIYKLIRSYKISPADLIYHKNVLYIREDYCLEFDN